MTASAFFGLVAHCVWPDEKHTNSYKGDLAMTLPISGGGATPYLGELVFLVPPLLPSPLTTTYTMEPVRSVCSLARGIASLPRRSPRNTRRRRAQQTVDEGNGLKKALKEKKKVVKEARRGGRRIPLAGCTRQALPGILSQKDVQKLAPPGAHTRRAATGSWHIFVARNHSRKSRSWAIAGEQEAPRFVLRYGWQRWLEDNGSRPIVARMRACFRL